MTSQADPEIQRLVETVGTMVSLLVSLERAETESRVTKEHHYSVKSDVTPKEILDRCLQVLSDVILDDVVDVKHFQLIINRLFAAGTITTRFDSDASMSANSVADFPVDVFDQTMHPATSLDQLYDADDSASSSDDEPDETTSVAQSTAIVVSEKIIATAVEIIIGLGKKEIDSGEKHHGRIVEYGLAKLATLCGNADNLKCFVNAKLCSKLLEGLGDILRQPANGGTLPVTLLEVITVLSSYRMSRGDFRQLVAFFKTCPLPPEPNLSLILDHLHRAVSSTSRPATDLPTVFLKFPPGAP